MKIDKASDLDDPNLLPQRFFAMCVQTWLKYGQCSDALGPAMLAHAINLMLRCGEPDEVANILAGLAVQISNQPQGAGHA
jgi:hypothetical protein